MYKLLLLLPLLTYVSTQATVSPHLVNKNVERLVDLSSQLAKITTTITLENTGKDTISSFIVALEPDLVGSISFISVRDSLKDELKLVQLKEPNTYNVILKQAIAAGRTASVILEVVLSNAAIPYPSSITMKEKQFVRYFGNHYFYSPYPTTKQTTSVTMNSRNIESFSKLKPFTQSESTIKYGPYSDVKANSVDAMIVHYENNAPFLRVTRLERFIEVSHWGNIAIQENIEILHTGAKLKGAFSRYDYQRETGNVHHSIKSYRTILPAAAHSIYYRDSNGNISTSQVRPRKDYIELELRPRFPLFGGWKSSYTLGYSVPGYQYLFKSSSSQYTLKMRLLDHVFDDMHVEELETHIVLPVGVKDVKLNLPYDATRLPDGVTHKYLDTLGRQVIKLTKSNLVEQHIQDLEVTYNWNQMLLLHEPFLVSLALYIMFIIVIIYVRLDFSISSGEHSKKE